MKINAEVTILFSDEGMHIEVTDCDASIKFLELRVPPKEACQALSRLSNVRCSFAEVGGLEVLGKRMEHKWLEFPLPLKAPLYGDELDALATRKANRVCPKGWVVREYFRSQGSYFSKEGDKRRWARCLIRRWVPKKENQKGKEKGNAELVCV